MLKLPETQEKVFITLLETSELLGISYDRCRLLANKGDIPAKRYGKSWRIYKPALIAEAQKVHNEGASQGDDEILEVICHSTKEKTARIISTSLSVKDECERLLGLKIDKKRKNCTTR